MNIKGSALIHARNFIQSRWGHESTGLSGVLERLEPASRQLFTSNLLSHAWYPVAVWNEVVEQAARRTENPSRTVRELAAYVAQEDLTTAYKILLKIGTPEMVFRRAGVFWSKYFDGGKSEGFPTGPKHFMVTLEALGRDAKNDPGMLTCREAVPSWQENAIRLTGTPGGKSVHVKCRFDGHDRCEYDVSWEG